MRMSYNMRLSILTSFLSILHILDSLPTSSLGMKEGKQLQHIFLKHFEETPFKEGRISTNVPQVNRHLQSCSLQSCSLLIYPLLQVPRQPNEKDCACFTIYFAKKFLQDPESTLTLVKVLLFLFQRLPTDFPF